MKAMATNHFKHISLLILLCALFSKTAQAQYTLTDDDVVVTDGVITSYSATETDIIIPNMLDGQVITSIGFKAFLNKSLTSVDLSHLSSLTTIGYNAFQGNPQLTTVNVSGLTNLTAIESSAFNGCGFSNFDFASLTNLKSIGNHAFRATYSLSSTGFSDLTNLTSIGTHAFFLTSITSFILPSPTTTGYSFDGWTDGTTTFDNGDEVSDFEKAYTANVESLVDYSITYHADGGTHANAANTYTVEDVVTLNPASKSGYIFSGWYTEPEFTNEITEIAAGTTGDLNLYAQYQYTLTDDDVVVTDGVLKSYSSTETDIIIPNMLDGQVITAIGPSAFLFKSLTGVDLSNLTSLTTIGNFAFHGNSITSVDFTGLTNLTTIEYVAFEDNLITSVDFTGLTNLTTIGNSAFRLNSITSVDFTGLTNLTTIELYAFRENSISIVDFTGLTNLTTIGDWAFRENSISTIDFTGLTNLTTIGNFAFQDNSITSVDFTGLTNLTKISQNAFDSNTLTSFALPTPQKEGYTYSWSDGETNYANGDIVDDLTVTYTATANLVDYTITYHAEGATHDNTIVSYTIEDEEVTFSSAAKSGYTFEGWFAEDSFTNEITEITTGATGDLDLYAKFGATDYDITYHAEGATHDNPDAYTIEDALTLTAATKEGYTFAGWYTEPELTNAISEIESGTTGDLDLYAKFKYTLTDDDVVVEEGVITSYTGSETNIIIPEMLDGQVIRSIGSYAFQNKSLREVDLSNMTNLMTIKSSAFAFSSLSAIDLTNLTQLTTIGQAAFYGNSLTELTLPTPMLDGEWRSGSNIYASGATVVDFLNEYLYTSDTPYTLTSDDVEVVNGELVSVQMEMNYSNIIIPNNLDDQEIIAIGEGAFLYSTITSVDFSALTNLTTIGEGAFYQCDLATVDLSGLSSLTTIGAEAFAYGGSITSINLTGLTNLTTIEANAFDYNLLTSVDFSGLTNLTTIGVGAFSRNDIISLNFTGVDNLKSIEDEAFAYNALTSIDFSGLTNLTTIGEYAFEGNSLTSVNFTPLTNLRTILEGAFEDNSLTSVDFTGLTNLTSIEGYVFADNSLAAVDLSGLSNLIKIGKEAFFDNSLTAVDLTPLTNLTTIGLDAFTENDLEEFVLPTPSFDGEWRDQGNEIHSSGSIVSVYEAYYYTSDAPYTLTSDDVVVEQGEIISVLPKMNYTNIVIPNDLDGQDVLVIGEDAFHEIGLKSLDLSGLINLITIERFAFYSNELTTVDLTGLTNLTTIGWGAFASNVIPNFTLPSPQTAGYNFDGWLKTGRTETRYANGAVVDDLNATYTAVVESLVNYTISYESDGGSHTNVVNTYTVENDLTLSAATKEGYAFDGWFTEPEFTNEITALSGGYTGDLTLFAKFTAVDYAITYHLEGGSHDNPDTYTIEEAVTLAAATKDGFEFEGWYTDEKFTTEITEIAKGSTGEVALYAKFTEIVLSLFDTGQVALTLYPNPVTHSFSVDAAVDQINVLNLDGQLVQTYIGNQAKYNVSHLASGHYIVQLIKAHKTLGAQKVIIDSGVR